MAVGWVNWGGGLWKNEGIIILAHIKIDKILDFFWLLFKWEQIKVWMKDFWWKFKEEDWLAQSNIE